MNISQFIEETDSALLAQGNEEVLTKTVKHFSHKGRLFDLINSVLDQNFDNLLEKSYLHPNGFDKLVLVSGQHFNLRLHNFHPPKVMKPAERVHNHKWEFASSILLGGYQAQEFNIHSGDSERCHYQYSKEQGLVYQGQSHVLLTDEYEVKAGTTYFMPGDVYHSITKISDEGCITVMMTGYTTETTTNVFSFEKLDLVKDQNHCGLKMYTEDEIKDTLTSVKEKLK